MVHNDIIQPLTTYEIRWAERHEVLKLPQIEQAAAQRFQPYLAALELTPDLMQDIVSISFLLQAQKLHHLWVALVDSELIGFVVGRPLVESFFVVELDVLPAYGHRGIGTALMKTLCQGAQEQGFNRVTLTTFRQIPWNIPFYQRLGFEIVSPSALSAEIEAIVHHEEQYGFKRQYRTVMQRHL